MKICPKCNREYDDEIIFCKQDGTKLEVKAEGLACPNCGKILEADTKFCSECGTKIIEQNICQSCGKKLLLDAKFCSECGTKVGDVKTDASNPMTMGRIEFVEFSKNKFVSKKVFTLEDLGHFKGYKQNLDDLVKSVIETFSLFIPENCRLLLPSEEENIEIFNLTDQIETKPEIYELTSTVRPHPKFRTEGKVALNSKLEPIFIKLYGYTGQIGGGRGEIIGIRPVMYGNQY